MNENIAKAVDAIRRGELTERAACRKFKVNRSHLRIKLRDAHIKELKSQRFVKPDGTLLLFDLHIPHHDMFAIDLAVEYAKKHFNIKHIILGGDFLDCEALSRFDKSKDTRKFSDEIYAANSFLRGILAEFPGADITYIVGNHEERIEKYVLKNAPELAELPGLALPDLLDFSEKGIKLVDNRKELEVYGTPFQYHGWRILHGHELGICPVTDPARRYLERAKTNVIVGHIHKTDSRIMTTLDGQTIKCCSVGTLAKRNPQYMPFNGWVQGFAVMEHSDIWYVPDIVHNFSICNGAVI